MSICRYMCRVLLVLAVICLVSPAFGADGTAKEQDVPKRYSPFDEPKPKVPDEIFADKRLDQKVKVFVKDKNFKQLFTELSEKTGLKISAARELWGERAIVYFHNRPIRDVMTEISDLYGFCWLVKGKSGAYEYEMFEDMRRVERMKKVKEDQKKAEDALLMDFIHQYFDESKRKDMMARLGEADPDSALIMNVENERGVTSFFTKFGEDFFKKVLAEQSLSTPISGLPQGTGGGFGEWLEKTMAANNEVYNSQGHGSWTTPYGPEDANEVTVTFRRGSSYFGTAKIHYEVRTPRTVLFEGDWPSLKEKAFRAAAGMDAPERVLTEKPLPEKPAITAGKLRRLSWRMTLLPGDVLEPIGTQSDLDAIADYHFDIGQIGPIVKTPLSRVVRDLCDSHQYACQFDGSTLRFKCERWYEKELMEEPPEEMLTKWQTKIEQTGLLDIHDLLRMASLPDRQFKWPGLKLMPGPDSARWFRRALSLWASLSREQEELARSDEGLPISQLSAEQGELLGQWATEEKMDMSAGFERAVIQIRNRSISGSGYTEVGSGSTGTMLGDGLAAGTSGAGKEYVRDVTEWIVLRLPDDRSCNAYINIPGQSLREGENLAARRKADAEADVIEIVQ